MFAPKWDSFIFFFVLELKCIRILAVDFFTGSLKGGNRLSLLPLQKNNPPVNLPLRYVSGSSYAGNYIKLKCTGHVTANKIMFENDKPH